VIRAESIVDDESLPCVLKPSLENSHVDNLVRRMSTHQPDRSPNKWTSKISIQMAKRLNHTQWLLQLDQGEPDRGEPYSFNLAWVRPLILYPSSTFWIILCLKFAYQSTKYWLHTRRRGAAKLKVPFALQPANKQAWRVLKSLFGP
jgi:hypothetical protein